SIIIGPFALSGASGGVWDSLFCAVGRYPVTHLNGFSLWFWLNPMAAPQLGVSGAYYPDSVNVFAGLSPRAIGLLATGAAGLAIAWLLWRDRRRPGSIRQAAQMLPLVFFLLPTQIHERYLFPAIALWAVAYSPRPRWWIGWLVIGGMAWLNTAWVWPGPAQTAVADQLGALLHRTWMGAAPGVWCAAALAIGLAVMMLNAFFGRRRRQLPNGGAVH
ncbi:MAG: hypothetical protein V3T70_01560, partial [Phycisphaerae bacterium]